MNNHLVLDTSVYLNYARFGKLYRLVNMVDKYGLSIFIDDKMLVEIQSNLPRVMLSPDYSVEQVLLLISTFTIHVHTISLFTKSPDPKDNFLFDLALQTGSEVIVTKETALLNFEESPVAVHDIKWFKETYPVPL